MCVIILSQIHQLPTWAPSHQTTALLASHLSNKDHQTTNERQGKRESRDKIRSTFLTQGSGIAAWSRYRRVVGSRNPKLFDIRVRQCTLGAAPDLCYLARVWYRTPEYGTRPLCQKSGPNLVPYSFFPCLSLVVWWSLLLRWQARSAGVWWLGAQVGSW